ncbi:site-specific integrase [Macromonas nakdongensis]|uniref:site-specific integrase n=1 Tax=Macromonas nakdongensis TaxID=1843082 RepID=UPI000C33FF65|nr:site-specific integrase [Macromonas nakdongensis]
MGTITARKRRDGTTGYTAQIRLKQGGKVIHTESQTFDRRPAAALWLTMREDQLAQPGAIEALQAPDPTLAQVIAQYLKELRKPPGKTKAQVLHTIAAAPLSQLKCSAITSLHITEFAQSLQVKPQTVGNYLSHLATIFRIARPAWGYPLNIQAIDDARTVGKKLGITGRSRSRERRPTLTELHALLQHYTLQASKRFARLPMVDLILFALFSTRRQEEITRITWADLDATHSEIIVRDMKNPGEKIGNDVRVNLPAEALSIIQRQAREEGYTGPIFPYNSKSISSSFTRACLLLGIHDLNFHDLRHEGVSRLFEMGKSIPQVAAVSGHRSWASLKRYTHIRQVGDKYAGWEWTPAMP